MGLRALTANQRDVLEALAQMIVPTDELGPGAREARVAEFIDQALMASSPDDRSAFMAGLEATDNYASREYGAGFTLLGTVHRAAVLSDVDQGKADGFGSNSSAFFALLRSYVIEGMFSDPAFGGNADYVGWKLIGYPGHKLTLTPDDLQLDAIVRPVWDDFEQEARP
jgi:gluconate 2-dehydrogenase gamma chain